MYDCFCLLFFLVHICKAWCVGEFPWIFSSATPSAGWEFDVRRTSEAVFTRVFGNCRTAGMVVCDVNCLRIEFFRVNLICRADNYRCIAGILLSAGCNWHPRDVELKLFSAWTFAGSLSEVSALMSDQCRWFLLLDCFAGLEPHYPSNG